MNLVQFEYSQNPTNLFGLSFQPSLGSQKQDDHDWIEPLMSNGEEVTMSKLCQTIKTEFSDRNRTVLKSCIDTLISENRLDSILEIGVNRTGLVSSTHVVTTNKLQTTKYIGIDLIEENLRSVRNNKQNIFCLQQNSSNFNQIMQFANSVDVEEFDLVIIDGWHSVSQVLRDWLFVTKLKSKGIVVMHDTNYHPGPWCLYEAINPQLFDKQKHCEDGPTDFGISTARLIK